ncbi:hypothetical protein [Terrimonas ferruginea]|jgi:hypothetical protein|uniref:hypothetical protein n=1 Tax=Terrimonas ferruginea TaxID=249 RepID=UPI000428F889|nr:hypothetical protein [Terrimonas ferruginea]
MKFLIAFLLTAALAFTGGLYFDWWIIAPAAFITAVLVRQRPGMAFLAGFLAVFLLWAGLSYWIDVQNQHILATRIAKLMGVGSPFMLVIVTGLVGGLVGGLAALSGSFMVAIKPSSRS